LGAINAALTGHWNLSGSLGHAEDSSHSVWGDWHLHVPRPGPEELNGCTNGED